MKVEGQCHCGAIRFEAEVASESVSVCHCNDCQALSGSPFRATVSAPADGFRLLKGMPRQYVKTADSGAKRVQAFCEHCGSPVYSSALDNPTAYTLRIGTLAQRHELGPLSRQVWTRRRLAVIPPIDGIQTID